MDNELTALLDSLDAGLKDLSATAEGSKVDDPPWLLPNQIKHLAEGLRTEIKRYRRTHNDGPFAGGNHADQA